MSPAEIDALKPPPDFDARVDQAVAPIPASPRRKRAMRAELLAHLMGAYEEERTSGHSPQTALAATTSRFGNLDLLREELWHTVPLMERLIYRFISLREPRMLKWILFAIGCAAIGLSMILPALAKIKAGEKFTSDAAVPFSIGVAIALVGLIICLYKITRKLRQPPRSA